jgi:hypothetical protein
MNYRLTNREFSRLWRRSKAYSAHEIKWLARRRGFSVRSQGTNMQVIDPASEKVVANFEFVKSREEKRMDYEKERAEKRKRRGLLR